MADGPTSLDDFTPEQLNALQDIAQARIDDSLSRRDALKALGMVGGGAAVGAGGSTALTEPAKADASTTDSDGDVGTPNDPVDGFFDGVDAQSVHTKEADITNETLIRANSDTGQTGLSSGSWTPVDWDNEEYDELGEFDLSGNTITVSETGWYFAFGQVRIAPGADQDSLAVRFRDNTATSTILRQDTASSGSGDDTIIYSGLVNLTAGNNYTVDAVDFNSTFDIRGNPKYTIIMLRGAFR